MTSVEKVTIPEGYKQTEVGVIPEDWVVTTIENVLSITTGNKNTQDKVADGIYPFYVRSQTVERINSYTFDGEGVLTAGDGVGTGKIFHYINGKCDIHQRVYLMHKFSDRLHGYYFYIYFKNNFYDKVMSMTAKSSVDSVRREMIADMYIALPVIKEQTAIANALSDVDNLIAALETLIAKKSAIKTAAMQQLLTGKTRLPGFGNQGDSHLTGSRSMADTTHIKDTDQTATRLGYKQTELGEVPEDWELVELGESVEFLDGLRRPVKSGDRERMRGEYRYYGASGVVDYVNDYLFDGEYILLGEDGENILSRNLPLAFKVTGKFWVNNHAHIMQPNIDFNIDYLASFLECLDYSLLNSGTAQPKLNKQNCLSIKVIKPTKREQAAIATVLSDMDTELDALQQRLSKTQKIKQGMMQELLTGKTRLL
ncbi:restriction endonuclease subunit S [Marinomonas sp. A79]|uniref:Restriction endonuclease subunit S n=1 Tax=Marinomonas vulgaris TaxID=2823372 RepID=A0ABS5HF21_9GAMM|nr:restriction endonuclease subunit S [Marinomonas vulgaris]MBR7890132.1 restriction endonuclease subunit S [Marinomonas vulgaris]